MAEKMCFICERYMVFREGRCLGCLKAAGLYHPKVESRKERLVRFRQEAESEVEAMLRG